MYCGGGWKRLVSRMRHVCVLDNVDSGLMNRGKIMLCEDLVKGSPNYAAGRNLLIG